VLLQLAPLVHPARLKRIMDWFWSRRLLSGPSAKAELADVMHRGRHGTAALRALLDGLPKDYVPPASGIEARFEQIIADHDLPRMRRQVDLGDDERWCGRVDFLAVDVPLVVEIDSEKYHGSLTSTEDDEVRQARLESAGFRVERVKDFEVWHRANAVARRIRRATWDLRAGRAA
jgi:very-short-patch-repair endonuclease